MTKQYNNRAQMLREELYGNEQNMTGYTREQIIEHYTKAMGVTPRFKAVATSAGTYGVNGAVVDVFQSDNPYNETYDTFYIKERNTTLLSFV